MINSYFTKMCGRLGHDGLFSMLFKDICKALWCHRVGRKCETKFMPAAEGSACGPDMVI